MAIGFEAMMPRASEALVDATRHTPVSASLAWQAWLFLVGVYLADSLIRNLGFRFFWNPLAAANMEEMTNEAFRRVQRSRPTGTATPSPAPPCGASRAPCGATTWSPTRWSCGSARR